MASHNLSALLVLHLLCVSLPASNLYTVGRNNEKNIKKHNDKLHKAQDKAKKAEMLRKDKLKAITKKFNASQDPESK